MAESPKKYDRILVMGLGPLREAPRRQGETISDFKKFLIKESLPVPDRCRVKVFTMDVQEKVPGTILKKEPGMLNISSKEKTQLFSGTTLEVTQEYVIAESDMSIEFVAIL